jgi:hypothetical protein
MHLCEGSHAYIVAFFLANLARLAFYALPGVRTDNVSDGPEIHASRMAYPTSAGCQK